MPPQRNRIILRRIFPPKINVHLLSFAIRVLSVCYPIIFLSSFCHPFQVYLSDRISNINWRIGIKYLFLSIKISKSIINVIRIKMVVKHNNFRRICFRRVSKALQRKVEAVVMMEEAWSSVNYAGKLRSYGAVQFFLLSITRT